MLVRTLAAAPVSAAIAGALTYRIAYRKGKIDGCRYGARYAPLVAEDAAYQRGWDAACHSIIDLVDAEEAAEREAAEQEEHPAA